MADVRNFKFNTDYPVDKIVFLKELTLTPVNSVFSDTIPHNLGAIPFCCGVASNDDFQTTYPSGTEITEGGQYAKKRFDITSDATNVYINGWLEDNTITPHENKPVRIQVWGFFNEDDTWNVPVAPTSAYNAFILNTDYNYPSLMKEGLIAASGASQSIKHGLGYIPFCMVWTIKNNVVSQIGSLVNMGLAAVGMQDAITIDTNFIVLPANTQYQSVDKYYYRIYGHDTSL